MTKAGQGLGQGRGRGMGRAWDKGGTGAGAWAGTGAWGLFVGFWVDVDGAFEVSDRGFAWFSGYHVVG